METRDLVESIIVADEDTNQKFLDLFASKITNALEVRKVEIASGLMSEAMEGRKVSDYPHFHELAYGAMAQNAAGTKKQAGNVSIDPEHVPHVEKAEAELKAMKEKGADLVRMGGDLDDGAKPKGMKHAHKALGRVLYEQVEQIDELKDKTYAAVVRARSGVEDDLEHGGENWKGDNTKYKQALRRISKRRGSDEGRRLYKKYPPGKNPMANEDVEQANEAAVALPAADLNALRLMKDIDRAGTTNALRMYHRGGGDINKLSMKHRQLVTDYLSKAGGLGKVSRGAMASALRTKKEQDTEE